MEMKLLQVAIENNNVHIKAEFLEISVETSIIKLKNIDKLFLVNSSFKNNNLDMHYLLNLNKLEAVVRNFVSWEPLYFNKILVILEEH